MVALRADGGAARPSYRVIDTLDELRRYVTAQIMRGERLVFADTETTGKNPRAGKLVAVQLMADKKRVPVIVDWRRAYDRGEAREWAAELAKLFDAVTLVFHNAKFDVSWLMFNRVPVPRVWCTQLAEQVVHGLGMEDGGSKGVEFNLRAVAERRLELDLSKAERKWFYEPAPLDERPDEWAAPFPEGEARYMALDVQVLPGIYEQQLADLQVGRLREVADIEMRAVPSIARMELRGLLLDVDGWRAFIGEKQENAAHLENEALKVFGAAIQTHRIREWDAAMCEYREYRAALGEVEAVAKATHEGAHEDAATYVSGRVAFLSGPERYRDFAPREGEKWGAYKARVLGAFKAGYPGGPVSRPKLDRDAPNIGSSVQLAQACAVMGIPLPKNPKTGKPKTDKATIEELSAEYPQMAVLNAYRHEAKFVESFGENLLAKIDAADGRLHSDYQQIGASTGRMSCRNPNSQQFPSKGEDGARLRSLVRAMPGWKLLTADFSNIELRILAELSRDANLLAAFASGKDVHSETARMMFGLGPDVDVKHTEFKPNLTYRNVAKTINFGLVYGMGPKKLARSLGVTLDEAKELMRRYFDTYSGAKRWLDEARRAGRERAYAETMAGRRRYFDIPREPVRQRGESWDSFKERKQEYTGLIAGIERQAGNTPIQGTSADITKLALALFHEYLMAAGGKLKGVVFALATVHDEIVVEAREDAVPVAKKLLKRAMYEACRAYLKVVRVDEPEVSVEDFWAKD